MRAGGTTPVGGCCFPTRAHNVQPARCVHVRDRGLTARCWWMCRRWPGTTCLRHAAAHGQRRGRRDGWRCCWPCWKSAQACRCSIRMYISTSRAGMSCPNRRRIWPLCAAVASSVRERMRAGRLGGDRRGRSGGRDPRRVSGGTPPCRVRETRLHDRRHPAGERQAPPRAGRHAGLWRGNAGRSAGDSVRIKSNGIGRTNDGRSLCADLRKSVAGGARRASVFLSLQLCYTKKEEYMI